MAGESQQSSNIWLPSLIVAVVAGTSYLVHQAAYQSSRPAEGGSWSHQMFVPEDVEARLWQDPLFAVNRHLVFEGDHGGSAVQGSHHDREYLAGEIRQLGERRAKLASPPPDGQRPTPAVTVFAVMVPRAPYSEAGERRRRLRYAVLSGLGRRGWVPQDQEHIHYFETHGLGASTGTKAFELPPFVPYEWLKHVSVLSGLRAKQASDPPGRVLVLWVPTEASERCPATGVATLLTAITHKIQGAQRKTALRLIVMGPPESGTLAELLLESIYKDRCPAPTIKGAPRTSEVVKELSVYSPWASAADRELVNSVRDELAEAKERLVREKSTGAADELSRCLAAADLSEGSAAPPPCHIEPLISPHVKFVRLIADDSLLSQALLLELQRRGIDPACDGVRRRLSPEQEPVRCRAARLDRHRIAIVSEWDAPYQRALRQTLSRTVAERCMSRFPEHRNECPRPWPSPWVVPFSYLRGVDGQLADAAGGKSAPARAPKAESSSGGMSGDPLERADGDEQLDYVRRLARRIERMDSEYENRGESAFGAIGVLGTDTYDKLTILQALREQFPDKIFFTTNLDARLLHPSQSAWARNLVVISAFDLRLEQCLQRDIPPLRDGYQTAAFFAVQVALRDGGIDATRSAIARQRERVAGCAERGCDQGTEPNWTRPWLFPLAFEVGRTGAFRLEPYSRDVGQGADEGPGACAANMQPVEMEVHPPAPPLFPGVPERVRGVLALSSGLIAALLVFAVPWQPGRRRSSVGPGTDGTDPRLARRPAPWRRKLAVATGAALAVAVIGYSWDHVWTFLTESGRGEPAQFFEGISIWVGEFVNLVCALLALIFVLRSNQRLSRNLEEIRSEFPISDGCDPPQSVDENTSGKHSLYSWLAIQWRSGNSYLRDCFGIRRRASDPANQAEAESSAAWDRYCREADTCPRFLRVVGWTLLYLTLAYCMQRAWPLTAPSRGLRSTEIDQWVTWLTIACFGLLLFYVFDALMICNRCIRRLVSEPPNWGNTIPQRFGLTPEIRGSKEVLKQWTAIQLIAKRTEAVGPLVYWPFLLLFLMIVGRNPVLERWSVSESLIVIVLVSVALIVYAALSLRWTTEAIRNAAIQELSRESIAAEGSDDRKTSAQLKALIAALRELKRGAFAPYTEQHFIRALLLPLGGYAGSALLQYLTLVKP